MIFFSFTSALAETYFHLPFTCSQASRELLSLPAGCCHLVFVAPYHSLLFHVSLFSVIFQNRSCLFVHWTVYDHDDDRDTLRTVPELNEATASSITNHSSLLSSSSSSLSDEESATILFYHPSISLFTSHFLCVLCRSLATDVNMHDLGVCSPPIGRTIASRIAQLTTSWYFLIFNSCPKIRFKSVGAENHNRLHCTTLGTSILKSNCHA